MVSMDPKQRKDDTYTGKLKESTLFLIPTALALYSIATIVTPEKKDGNSPYHLKKSSNISLTQAEYKFSIPENLVSTPDNPIDITNVKQVSEIRGIELTGNPKQGTVQYHF